MTSVTIARSILFFGTLEDVRCGSSMKAHSHSLKVIHRSGLESYSDQHPGFSRAERVAIIRQHLTGIVCMILAR